MKTLDPSEHVSISDASSLPHDDQYEMELNDSLNSVFLLLPRKRTKVQAVTIDEFKNKATLVIEDKRTYDVWTFFTPVSTLPPIS